MKLSIQFLGGVGTVTGSKYCLDDGRYKMLIDCGLFQGLKDLRLQNRAPLSVDPESINAVVLTHAHLDHTGYIPLLYKQGFRGPIFCTAPTRDLAKIILADSAHLQEEDAEFANEKGFTKHHPAQPLYTREDADHALKLFVPIDANDWTEILPGWKLRFQKSGHILGSAFAEITNSGEKVVFSGDLGRHEPLILEPPQFIEDADYLLIESTYGDRIHPKTSLETNLADLINRTVQRGGHVLIPSFAIGRTQDMLCLLSRLRKDRKIPEIPIFLDSPMGTQATEIFYDYQNWHRLNSAEVQSMVEITTIVKSKQQSEELLRRRDPSIVIAGSGMVTGGRILHHLARRVSEKKNTVILVGFQAAGTRGRLLSEGINELKIHGEYHSVYAHIEILPGLSAHADQSETLSWLTHFKRAPKMTFIVHGEPQASDALRVRIQDQLGWSTHLPKIGETFSLAE